MARTLRQRASIRPPRNPRRVSRDLDHPGGTIPAGPNSNGELLTYQFLKTGRYLVICMNRSHLLNDWMFGFVNVTGE
jgi:hypothetical protein